MPGDAGTVVLGRVVATLRGRSPRARLAAATRPQIPHASWGQHAPPRPVLLLPWGAAPSAATTLARGSSGPLGPSAPSRGWPWHDAPCPVLPPLAGAGAPLRVPQRRLSPCRGPMASARRSGRTSRQASSPFCAWPMRGRCGASPRRGMRRRRPSMRRGGRRARPAARATGCHPGRLSTLRTWPWGPTTSARLSGPPGCSPASPPPRAHVAGAGRRPGPCSKVAAGSGT